MSLPFEKLTQIMGEQATDHTPESETTPEFMNGKFEELRQNDVYLNNQINVLNDNRGYLQSKNLGGGADLSKQSNGIYTGYNPIGFESGTLFNMIKIGEFAILGRQNTDELQYRNVNSDGTMRDWVVLNPNITTWLTDDLLKRHRKPGKYVCVNNTDAPVSNVDMWCTLDVYVINYNNSIIRFDAQGMLYTCVESDGVWGEWVSPMLEITTQLNSISQLLLNQTNLEG